MTQEDCRLILVELRAKETDLSQELSRIRGLLDEVREVRNDQRRSYAQRYFQEKTRPKRRAAAKCRRADLEAL